MPSPPGAPFEGIPDTQHFPKAFPTHKHFVLQPCARFPNAAVVGLPGTRANARQWPTPHREKAASLFRWGVGRATRLDSVPWREGILPSLARVSALASESLPECALATVTGPGGEGILLSLAPTGAHASIRLQTQMRLAAQRRARRQCLFRPTGTVNSRRTVYLHTFNFAGLQNLLRGIESPAGQPPPPPGWVESARALSKGEAAWP